MSKNERRQIMRTGMDVREKGNIEGYRTLKTMVIFQACQDYFHAIKNVKKWEDKQSAKVIITRELVRKGEYRSLRQVEKCRLSRLEYEKDALEQIEHFFYSEWWCFWTDMKPDEFMRRVRKMVDEGRQKF